eukprot:3368936-Pleurochrysis_carterae.AAC.3
MCVRDRQRINARKSRLGQIPRASKPSHLRDGVARSHVPDGLAQVRAQVEQLRADLRLARALRLLLPRRDGAAAAEALGRRHRHRRSRHRAHARLTNLAKRHAAHRVGARRGGCGHRRQRLVRAALVNEGDEREQRLCGVELLTRERAARRPRRLRIADALGAICQLRLERALGARRGEPRRGPCWANVACKPASRLRRRAQTARASTGTWASTQGDGREVAAKSRWSCELA